MIEVPALNQLKPGIFKYFVMNQICINVCYLENLVLIKFLLTCIYGLT